MKKKIIWLVLSLSIVAALVLASCAPAAVEEKGEQEVVGEVEEGEAPAVTPEEEEAPAAEEEAAPVMESVTFTKLDGTKVTVEVEPAKYGGWLTTSYSLKDITTILDPVFGTGNAYFSTIPYERISQGDWTRGPRGTNEFPFTAPPAPDWVLGPQLAESVERPDLKTMIIHLRPGVYFHDIPPVNGREVTAEDWKFEWEREMAADTASFYYPPDTRPVITVIDKYTFKIVYSVNDVMMYNVASIRYPVLPWEIVDEDGFANDPDLQIGTGAFMLDDLVTDVSVSFVRNPNYWKYDPFHPQNKLPYLDGWTILVIPDYGTQKAAFRTGKIDTLRLSSLEAAEEIWETAPFANWRQNLTVGSLQVWMNNQVAPFDDVNVRRAVALAIDNDYINDIMFKGLGEIVAFPIGSWAGPSVYTPLEDMPEDVRILFEYHPDMAKELLTEAGYPNGFDATLITHPTSRGGIYVDAAQLVVEQLAKVGIDVEIELQDNFDWAYGRLYDAFGITFWEPAFAADALYYCYNGKESPYNFSNVSDPLSREAFATYNTLLDADERDAFLKEENLRELYNMYSVPLPMGGAWVFWQPWVKNYGGEAGTSTEDAWGWHTGFYNFWLDQDLKKEMGF